MKPVRVGIVCDLREEGWHSMDLVADMLLEMLPSVVRRRHRRDAAASADDSAMDAAAGRGRRQPRAARRRLTGRLWDYPRWLRPRARRFDVFHIVDHSYAHLIRALPAERTIVTCNDTDAFEAARGRRRVAVRSVAASGRARARRHLARVARRVHQRSHATGSDCDGPRRSVTHERRVSRRASKLHAGARRDGRCRDRSAARRSRLRGAARLEHHSAQAHRRAARGVQQVSPQCTRTPGSCASVVR